jgi:hypothetical protein
MKGCLAPTGRENLNQQSLLQRISTPVFVSFVVVPVAASAGFLLAIIVRIIAGIEHLDALARVTS